MNNETKLAEAEARINPPLPELDAKDHEIAKWRFIADKILESMFSVHYYLHLCDDGPRMDKAKTLLEGFFQRGKPDHPGEWGEFEAIAEEFRWNELKEMLRQYHCGDCTAVACTCDRCYVERYYGFATYPPSKSVGSKWLHEYLRLSKEEEN